MFFHRILPSLFGATIFALVANAAPTGPATRGQAAPNPADLALPGEATLTMRDRLRVTVTVNPASVALLTGQRQSFKANVSGAKNRGVVWTVDESNGGSIDALGQYFAPASSGVYHVRATSVFDPSKFGLATVTVTAPPAVGVSVTPPSVSLAANATQTFAAAVTGSSNTAVTWSVVEALGGSINSSGLYTAPGGAGTFHVRATSLADPSKYGQATITVTAPPAVGVSVTPPSVTLAANATQTFAAAVTGSSNTAVTWSVLEALGGTINSSGLYTAPGAAGTFHVRATSVADPAKFNEATVTVNPVAQPPVINAFSASPATITSGQSSVLSWTVSGATSLSINQGVGTVTGTSVSVAPAATTTYTLTATNAAGATATGTATVSVQVSGSPRPRILLNDPESLATLRAALMNNTSAAARFRGMVDGEIAAPGSRYGFEARHAALLFQLTGNANYGTYAVGLTETFVASEEALIAANQRATIAYDSYLEVGERLGNVAQVYDWCYDLLTPAQRTRWITYMNATLFNVWNPDQAVWGSASFPWSGWSINNPANNYYYSFLEATMLTGLATYPENPQAQQWRNQFANAKIQSQLIPLFNADLVGGGSREGTGYGTAMKNLFKLYFLWAKSTGERISDLTPHTRLTAYWLAHATVPTLDKLVPIGDHARESTAALFDYHRDLWLSLIAQYPEDPGVRATKQLLADSSVPQMEHSFTFWADFLYERPAVTPLPLATLNTAYYGSGTGNLFTRSSWSKTATLAHLIAGPYTESHAHRDQGSFVLYRGDWLLDDQNRRSHSGIEQDETMHNLVRFVDGAGVVTMVEGAPQSQMVALADHPSFTYALANVTPIYNGKEQVLKSERDFLFLKPGTLVVFDRAAANSASVARVFGLNMPVAPTVNGNLLSVVNGANRADVLRIAPLGVPWVTTAFGGAEFPLGGVRADASHAVGTESLFLHVIGTNQDVLSAVADHLTGTTGVSITFTDGRKAVVRFSNVGRGGTLEFRTAANGILFSGNLPTTVTAPPLLAAP